MKEVKKDYANIDEVIFVEYFDIIKSPLPVLLTQLPKHFKKTLDKFIDFSKIENKTNDELLELVNMRPCKNIIEYLAIKEFDYEKIEEDLINQYSDIFINSKLLSIGESLSAMLIHHKFVRDIYVYTEKYDSRIHYDIQNIFNNNKKVHYVTGKKEDVFKDIKGINSFFLSDIEDIGLLQKMNLLKYTNILVPLYGYNLKINKDGNVELKYDISTEMMIEHTFKFAMFPPFQNINKK